MSPEEFRIHAHKMVDRMADYLAEVEQYPVKSQVKPKEILNELPTDLPISGGSMDSIMIDFEKTILKGITHWESPYFFGYFPASKSGPSILAEMLTATLGSQCMLWATSPAAAELEERMMGWLKQLLHLPKAWQGCIQDTASTATLTALLTARERYSNFQINQAGFDGSKFRIYCSEQAHSSIDKAVKIAGFGIDNLVKIPTDSSLRLDVGLLEQAIKADLQTGLIPLFVIAAMGTTGTTAVDPIDKIGALCTSHSIWLHVDAAYSGTALMLEEKAWMGKGLEYADSFVFNPHKWMFVNFDCSIYFVKDSKSLVNTFSITPEYLRTEEDELVNNYRDWGIQLGRRFRALKLWFVLRYYGAEGLKTRIRNHCRWVEALALKIDKHPDFEVKAEVTVNLVCFRWKPSLAQSEQLNALNEQLMKRINDSGKMFLSHTKIGRDYVIRLAAGHPELTEQHLNHAWDIIQQTALAIE